MNQLAAGTIVTPMAIDSEKEDSSPPAGVDFEEEEDPEPVNAKINVDPNIVEVLGAEQEEEEDENPFENSGLTENTINDTTNRRSQRSTAGKTSRYDDYIRPDGISGFTSKWGFALTNLSIKVATERFGEKAFEAIKDELVQLIVDKEALKPMDWKKCKHLFDQGKIASILMSHMFLKEKLDGAGVFEKLKARLVGDGRLQARDEDYSSPTARVESIFNSLKITVEECRKLLVLDIGGAYLNAKMNEEVYMWLSKEVTEILVKIYPKYKAYVDERGRLLVKIEKALYGLIQSAKL